MQTNTTPTLNSMTPVRRNDELRRRLLAKLNAETAKVAELVTLLEHALDLEREDYVRYAQELIEAVDGVLDEGDWESSLFLRNTIKPLKTLRHQATTLVRHLSGEAESTRHKKLTPQAHQTVVYVSLFQARGHDGRSWEMQLRSLDKNVLGRPIYGDEETADKIIHFSHAPMNEAYAAVIVDKTAIKTSVSRQDRYANALLTLEENSVFPSQVIEFVHMDQRYSFRQGKLIRQTGKR